VKNVSDLLVRSDAGSRGTHIGGRSQTAQLAVRRRAQRTDGAEGVVQVPGPEAGGGAEGGGAGGGGAEGGGAEGRGARRAGGGAGSDGGGGGNRASAAGCAHDGTPANARWSRPSLRTQHPEKHKHNCEKHTSSEHKQAQCELRYCVIHGTNKNYPLISKIITL